MLLHLLSDQGQKTFLEIAWIFCIADNKLLYDGKTQDEITGTTDISKISIQIPKSEEAILLNFARECESTSDNIGKGIQKKFVEEIKRITLTAQNDPAERLKAAKALLLEKIYEAPNGTWPFATSNASEIPVAVNAWLFGEQPTRQTSIAAHPKVMLLEVMLLCLADGEISDVEKQLLQDFSRHVHIENFIFDDLLECAKSMNHEILKTLAIILE
jgi:hypothetical protein